jgi:hypothetical protein
LRSERPTYDVWKPKPELATCFSSRTCRGPGIQEKFQIPRKSASFIGSLVHAKGARVNAAFVLLSLGGRLRRLHGRWRLDAVCTQGPVDYHPNLLSGNGAIDAFAVDKYRRCSIDAQCLCFLC